MWKVGATLNSLKNRRCTSMPSLQQLMDDMRSTTSKEGMREGDYVYYEGYLAKRGQSNKTSWKVRYFQLTSYGSFNYFKSSNDLKPIGHVPLFDSVLRVSKNRPHGFEIVTKTRVWQLQCRSNSERDNWMRVLKERTYVNIEEENLLLEAAEKMIGDTSGNYSASMVMDLSQSSIEEAERLEDMEFQAAKCKLAELAIVNGDSNDYRVGTDDVLLGTTRHASDDTFIPSTGVAFTSSSLIRGCVHNPS